MPLTCCCLTGVDDLTPLIELAVVSDLYPYAEWGFPYSPKRQGTPGRSPRPWPDCRITRSCSMRRRGAASRLTRGRWRAARFRAATPAAWDPRRSNARCRESTRRRAEDLLARKTPHDGLGFDDVIAPPAVIARRLAYR